MLRGGDGQQCRPLYAGEGGGAQAAEHGRTRIRLNGLTQTG